MAKVAKKVFFNIPGFGRVNSLPGAEFDPGGSKRDHVTADTGVVGYTEEPMPPTLSFELPMMAGLSVDKLRNLTDVKVTVQYDTGQVWIVQDAWVAEPPKIKDGKIPISMIGILATEVK